MSENRSIPFWRRGWFIFTSTFGVAAVAGWLAYDAMMAPRWLRALAEQLAERAEIVSEVAPDTAFSTMKGRADPETPYICFSSFTDFTWDSVYFVPSGGPVPMPLSDLAWPGMSVEDINQRMESDSRYQIIAFVRDEAVVEFGFYFTIWGDLTAVASGTGFTPNDAVFIAESDGQSYSLFPADMPASAACSK